MKIFLIVVDCLDSALSSPSYKELGYPNQSEFHDDFSKVGEYESSEPTSLATTSTMEGEHTLSPGAGEDGGEGLGEVCFHLTPLSVL